MKNLYDVEIKLTSTEGIAAARTNEQATSIMREAIKKVLGTENVDPPLVTLRRR
ncbi:hypothetical protein PD280_11030 [Virgibacillus salarius]|uniref:hypothetical protein n=1 Tax=Virgibacillus salarius TaxID=447199 RepID=UPI0024904881|nr:hypothetical protein [Virgibacillus salarius]WBX82101.1 hypothetical protein PD280_11030 [Virgibacillus salarius]